MKKLTLMNYENDKIETAVEFNAYPPIERIEIKIISGDEIATVRWIDGTTITIDSDVENRRSIGYYDGEYTLYDNNWDVGRIDEMLMRFANRRNSYTLLYGDDLNEEE